MLAWYMHNLWPLMCFGCFDSIRVFNNEDLQTFSGLTDFSVKWPHSTIFPPAETEKPFSSDNWRDPGEPGSNDTYTYIQGVLKFTANPKIVVIHTFICFRSSPPSNTQHYHGIQPDQG